MRKEIWRVTDKDVKDLLEADAPELTDEEAKAILRKLPLYLDAAFRECLAELTRQEMHGRHGSVTWHPSGPRSVN